jgi:hypothetical protein
MDWEEVAEKHSPVNIPTFAEKNELKKKECVCINPVVKERSFNEDIELDYDKIGHVYLYQGKVLQGVTDYLHKFYDEFKLDMVAKSCAKLWGVDAQDIADLWESNGKVSSEFGTAIHNALEHYERFKELGAKIAKARQQDPIRDNYALPKHPVLRQIVQDFVSINTIKGNVLTEVLLTDVGLGLAGRADRVVILDKEKKICRIGDYKINIDAELKESKYKAKGFETLPNNKITKYQIQLSVYSNMLQKQGWTVKGIDIYIYEDEWKYYGLEVLKVI